MPERSSLVILVPAPLGGFRCFNFLRGLDDGFLVAEPNRLRHHLAWLPAPRIVVLCGRNHRKQIRDAVLDRAELYVLPATWLRSIPATAPRARAALAARLVTAHVRHPIEHFCAEELSFPF